MLCSTDMAECMLLVTTYLYMKMTKTSFKISCIKCNSLSIIIGVKQKNSLSCLHIWVHLCLINHIILVPKEVKQKIEGILSKLAFFLHPHR